jgi:hypothetical protein
MPNSPRQELMGSSPHLGREAAQIGGGYGANSTGTSTLTLAKGDPSYPGGVQPGTVDLDLVDAAGRKGTAAGSPRRSNSSGCGKPVMPVMRPPSQAKTMTPYGRRTPSAASSA